ncbi:phosphohistidine phosphatase SixA [Candidatus Wolfebacteria bacterium]|nr:MAG: phosphohistidine phosphatase SixA [Candidatus Wolfebacteria bacterium]
MKLYLVQHGQQNPENIDPEKNLSDKGKKDVANIAAFLRKSNIKLTSIYHSGKARAQQTADILAQSLTPNEVHQREGLNPMDPIDPMMKELETNISDIMIVGHLPYLSNVATSLLCENSKNELIQFQQGGVVCLEKAEDTWKLTWMIIPELLA